MVQIACIRADIIWYGANCMHYYYLRINYVIATDVDNLYDIN